MEPDEWINGSLHNRCEKCRQITPSFVNDEPVTFLQDVEIVHQNSFAALEYSASQGCKLCCLLRLELINTGVPIQDLEGSPGPIIVWRRFYGDHLRGAIQLRLGDGIITRNALLFRWLPTRQLLMRSVRIYNLVRQERDIDAVILQAREWIQQCFSDHIDCKTDGQRPPLPTRLLDVGPSEGAQDLRIFVPQEDYHDPAEQINYLTLSYCWGGSQKEHATTAENIDQRRRNLSSTNLPKTIKDAIDITRKLGQRYLWVDSLCIIQPIDADSSDWQHESSRMGQYYHNSFCTISATSAASTLEGCFFERPGMRFLLETCFIGDYFFRDGENTNRFGQPDLYCVLHPSIPAWEDAVEGGTLLTRGWAFQERVLSPRILHWTKDAVFWECGTLRASEYFPNPIIDDADEDISLNGLMGMLRLSTRRAMNTIRFGNLHRHQAKKILGEFWQQQITQYSTKDLTYSSDRLPALSGLAKMVQQYANDSYLAGLWRSTLLEGMTWYVDSNKDVFRPISRPHTAPSWSWSSVKRRIEFAKLPEVPVEYWPGPEKRLSHRVLFMTEIIHASVNLTGKDATGQVSAGLLQVRGPLQFINFKREGFDSDSTVETPYYRSLYFDRHRTVKIWLDDLPIESSSANALSFFCLQWYTYRGNPSPEVDPEGLQGGVSAAGVLLLAPTSTADNQYKRVGWALVRDMEWFDEAENTILDII